ncbi:MAG: hypothetical protein H0W63_03940 [Gemmatimonadaceae bacterium]|nr:hypothetical protein [Gemmatimonadaceae bacterium]
MRTVINLLIRILGAVVDKWTDSGFKPFYPPLCVICHAGWQIVNPDSVICAKGHVFRRPNGEDRPPLPNAGDHHGDI